MIDTHAHIDGDEFNEDFQTVLNNAKENGIEKILIPNINLDTINHIVELCDLYPGFLYPMIGIHPEDINSNQTDIDKWLKIIHDILKKDTVGMHKFIAIGEVGLDFYWDQTYKDMQVYAFEKQVQMAVEFNLPLMIHSRNSQQELVKVLSKYKDSVKGVFHCFTGNDEEDEQLLEFKNFLIGIGGVLTFKKSTLPQTVKNVIPLNRIVLETDAPYMAPVPMRGKRNEPAFVLFVAKKIAELFQLDLNTIDLVTTNNACSLFSLNY